MLEFNLFYFIFGLFFGSLGVYLIPPEIIVVHKTPTPLNLKNNYIDNKGNCYSYDMEEVQCNKNAKNII
jgi:hypothetical protein